MAIMPQIMGVPSGSSDSILIEGVPPTTYVECGFEPKRIMITDSNFDSNSDKLIASYAYEIDSAKYYQVYNGAASSHNLGPSTVIASIDSNGFTLGTPYSQFSSNLKIMAGK